MENTSQIVFFGAILKKTSDVIICDLLADMSLVFLLLGRVLASYISSSSLSSDSTSGWSATLSPLP